MSLGILILAGGLGSRIAEETENKPKPMIEIGGKPILWHIMKIYSSHGINDFVICCGYKGYVIKEYFKNYFIHMSDVTFSLKENKSLALKRLAFSKKFAIEQEAKKSSDLQVALSLQERRLRSHRKFV